MSIGKHVRFGSGLLVLAAVALLCACALAAMGAQPAWAATLTSAPSSSGLSKGDTFTVGGNKYKVNDAESDKGELTGVTLVKYGSKNKKPKINTVKYKGETFEVDDIGKNAFNNKAGHKVMTVTLGRNVDDIRAKAFYGCKKLKRINMGASDVIEIEKKNGVFVIDDIDIGKKAFAKAGTPNIKAKCGKSSATYRMLYKKALVKRGMRCSVTVVK